MTPGSPCETLAEEERLAWWAVEEYEVVMAEERLREDQERRENLRCLNFYSLYMYVCVYIYIYIYTYIHIYIYTCICICIYIYTHTHTHTHTHIWAVLWRPRGL